VYQKDAKGKPPFPEEAFEVPKWTTMVKKEPKLGFFRLFHLEVQVPIMEEQGSTPSLLCVYCHAGIQWESKSVKETKEKSAEKRKQSQKGPKEGPKEGLEEEKREYRYLPSAWDAEDVYSQLCAQAERDGFSKTSWQPTLAGSPPFRRQMALLGAPSLSQEVLLFVEELFAEANAGLARHFDDHAFSVPALPQIEEAEGVSPAFIYPLLPFPLSLSLLSLVEAPDID